MASVGLSSVNKTFLDLKPSLTVLSIHLCQPYLIRALKIWSRFPDSAYLVTHTSYTVSGNFSMTTNSDVYSIIERLNISPIKLKLTFCWHKRIDSRSNLSISFSTLSFSISFVIPSICSSNCFPNV